MNKCKLHFHKLYSCSTCYSFSVSHLIFQHNIKRTTTHFYDLLTALPLTACEGCLEAKDSDILCTYAEKVIIILRIIHSCCSQITKSAKEFCKTSNCKKILPFRFPNKIQWWVLSFFKLYYGITQATSHFSFLRFCILTSFDGTQISSWKYINTHHWAPIIFITQKGKTNWNKGVFYNKFC